MLMLLFKHVWEPQEDERLSEALSHSFCQLKESLMQGKAVGARAAQYLKSESVGCVDQLQGFCRVDGLSGQRGHGSK